MQAQVLRLLDDLRRRLGLALLFISHDIAVVRSLCERVVVLYLGRVMEQGPAAEILHAPRHPYTQALLSAVPRLNAADRRSRVVLAGDPPNPAAPPSGCVFRTRCPIAIAACAADTSVVATDRPRSCGCLHPCELGSPSTPSPVFAGLDPATSRQWREVAGSKPRHDGVQRRPI